MYKRRIKVFLALVGLMFAVLVGRLMHLQLFARDGYVAEARELLRRVELEPAIRGRIVDRNGRILAIDQPCYDLVLHYGLLSDDPMWRRLQVRRIERAEKVDTRTAAEIFERRRQATLALAREEGHRIDVDVDERIERLIDSVGRIRQQVGMDVAEQRQYHPIVPGLDEQAEVTLRARLGETVGAQVRPSLRRLYPYGEAACHLIGTTSEVWREDLERENLTAAHEADWLVRSRVNYLPGDVIGRSGVEQMCEDVLRGRRGYKLTRRRDVIEQDPARPGGDVHLTLDIELQRRLMEVWRQGAPENATGAIVVIGVERGELLASVSMPGYDLNSFRREYPDHLADEVNLPLMHRAIAAQYPPGSTVKPVSAVAGLASGQVGPHTTFNCAGIMHGSDRPNRCWIARYGVGHGAVDVVEAIQHSCNIYFYGVANRIGLEELGGWFKRFGLGSVPGTGLAGERAGNVPLDSPYRGEARNCSIGQGKMLATPMQVANMMATIARGGRFLSPIVSLEGGPPREARDLPATAEQIRLVHEGMHRVVDDRQGTAWKIFHQGAEPLGFGVCGKTGTAQASPQRVDGQIVREGDHAWFAGFAPYGRPTVAFAIIVEYAGGGGANAGPLARETLRACKQMGYIR